MTPAHPSRRRVALQFLLSGLAVAAAIVLGCPGTSRADIQINDNFAIGGFINYNYTFMDQTTDNGGAGFPADSGSDRNFKLEGEVDLKVKWSWATARFDLNLPSDGNEAPGIAPSSSNDIGIEQARFDIMPKFGESYHLAMTGGIFNGMYGREAQDPVDRPEIDTGLQFALTPTNLVGITLSAGSKMFIIGGLVANEWFNNTPQQLSYGAYATVMPTDKVSWFVGGLWSTQAVGDNYLYNSVLNLQLNKKNSLAFESTINQYNWAVGGTYWWHCVGGAEGGGTQSGLPLGMALRYDYIRARAGSTFASDFAIDVPRIGAVYSATDAAEYHQATVTGEVMPFDHLTARVEGTATRVNVNGASGDDDNMYTVKAELTYKF